MAESDETSAQNGSWIFGAHRSTVYLAVGVQFCLGCVTLWTSVGAGWAIYAEHGSQWCERKNGSCGNVDAGVVLQSKSDCFSVSRLQWRRLSRGVHANCDAVAAGSEQCGVTTSGTRLFTDEKHYYPGGLQRSVPLWFCSKEYSHRAVGERKGSHLVSCGDRRKRCVVLPLSHCFLGI